MHKRDKNYQENNINKARWLKKKKTLIKDKQIIN